MKELYCGIDIHKEVFVGNIMGEDGVVEREGSMRPTREGLQNFLCGLPIKAVAIEACGMWRGAYTLLTELGYQVKLANPLKTHQIACKRKTDKVDARILADLLRTRYLPEVYIPDEYTLKLRDLCRHKCNITRMKTRVQNKIKGYLLRVGIPYQKRLWNEKALKQLNTLGRDDLNDLIDTYWYLRKKENEVLRRVGAVARNTKQTVLLMTHPGIGELGSLMMVAEIADIGRFDSPKHLIAYAGLCPGIHQSANTSYAVENHAVNKWLKWIAVECAGRAAMLDKRYMVLFARVKRKKGFKIARREIARKMLRTAYHMLKNEEPYHAS